MRFRITGLSPHEFEPLFGLPDTELAARGARRHVVDKTPGFPDRIGLVDAEIGQTVLLVNYVHQPAASPYRASHAIYVREGATTAYDAIDEVPKSLRIRLLSLRAYDEDGMMVDARVVEGAALRPAIAQMFANEQARYIHAHNATRGCYAARIERA